MQENNDDLYVFSDESAEAGKSQEGWSILIMDDEKSHHQVVKDFFNACVFHDKKIIANSAYTTQDALEFLQTNTDQCLLLLRVDSIDKDAFIQFLQLVRANTNYSAVPIILYGAASDCPISAEEIMQFHVHSYMQSATSPDNKLHMAVMNAVDIFSASQELIQKKHELEEMQNAAKRFVPHSFLKMLNKDNIVDIALTDHVQKEMTVLFLDIRSFTTLSEFLTPVETFEFINNFLSYLEPSIDKNKGFIDKYIGDSVMALFPERPEDAVNAGIEMLKALEKYNITRLAKYQIPIKIGIGINTGMLVMGVIGFYDRMECTVISDAVNTASRMESFTKKVGTPLLISENTYQLMQDSSKINCRLIGNVGVPGKHEFISVYEVFDTDPGEVLEKKRQTKSEFEQAVRLFNKLDLQAAHVLFKKIVDINPHDLPAKYFVDKTNISAEKKDGLL